MFNKIAERAKKVMPGGVTSSEHNLENNLNSALYVDCAKGACVYDVNTKVYIDYNMGGGSIVFGHNHPGVSNAIVDACKRGINFNAPNKNEIILAELIVKAVANVEMVRFFNSEQQAAFCALKLAKMHTNKSKVIKFSECCHSYLNESNSDDILTAQFNNLQSVQNIFMQSPNEIAAVIIEPVATGKGVIAPANGFLNRLRELCIENNALLILDDTNTGFRLCMGGAQEFYAFNADIVIMGKIIGGGFPIGVIGASANIMSNFAPLGKLSHSSVFTGNPIIMQTGVCLLTVLQNNSAVFSYINNAASSLQKGFDKIAKANAINIEVNRVGSLLSINFVGEATNNIETVSASNENAYNVFCDLMMKNGIIVPNVKSRIFYVSAAHTPQHINNTLEIANEVLLHIKKIDGI